MDNFFKTYENEDVAIYEKPLIEEILQDAAMPLQGWISNSSKFNNHFEVEESKLQNVLGIQWDVEKDTFQIVLGKKFPFELEGWKPTKRNFMGALVSVFDPLGLIGPLLVQGKLFLQGLWKNKYSWDEELPVVEGNYARKLLTDFLSIDKFEFPRQVINKQCHLHVFTDASAKAYGAVAYSFDYVNQVGNVLVSKQRIAPCNKNTLTIPKLELTAVLIGCRLIKHLLTLFQFVEIYLWSDSKVVISWIHCKKCIKDIYVSNRVSEIKDIINSCQINIRHVGTNDNPADVLSRGCTVNQLIKDSSWMHGPIHLMSNPVYNVQLSVVHVSEIITEIVPCPSIAPVVPLSEYSTYAKAYAVTKNVLLFGHSQRDPLEALIYQEQRQHTPSLYAYVTNTNTKVTPDIKETARQLNLIFVNNTLCCKGRVEKSDLDEHTHTPYFLRGKVS